MRRKHIVLGIIAFTLANVALLLPISRSKPPDGKPGAGGRTVEGVDRRISAQVTGLEKESLDESLTALDEIEMYVWPGPTGEMGFEVSQEGRDRLNAWTMHCLMSNRRLRKVMEELASLPSKEAADKINRQIEATLPTYEKILNKHLEFYRPLYAPDAKLTGTPPQQISNNPDGSPTLLGARYKLLGLALIAGNLELAETRPAVLLLAQTAKRQYEEFSRDEELHELFKFATLCSSSLYHPQVLATALLGTCTGAGEETTLVEQFSKRWETEELVDYRARATKYDLHARIGMVPVEPEGQLLTVRYLQPLTDKEFEMLLAELCASP